MKRFFCFSASMSSPSSLIVFGCDSQEAESNRLCRRLQLKDIIPVEVLRLTKYPLLLDNIVKYTGAFTVAWTLTPTCIYKNVLLLHTQGNNRNDI